MLTAVPTVDGVSNGSKWYVKYDHMPRQIKFIRPERGGSTRILQSFQGGVPYARSNGINLIMPSSNNAIKCIFCS